ncbi:MAG: acyl carrier protein [Gammaproteobacteria bacterium]
MTAITLLLDYIRDELLDDADDIAADDNLLADGMVDSLGMLRLMDFIEQTFGITVPPEDFTIENFRTIDMMIVYLRARGVDIENGQS